MQAVQTRSMSQLALHDIAGKDMACSLCKKPPSNTEPTAAWEDCANHAHREDRPPDAHLPVCTGIEDTCLLHSSHFEGFAPWRPGRNEPNGPGRQQIDHLAQGCRKATLIGSGVSRNPGRIAALISEAGAVMVRFWALVLLFLIVYVFALIFTQAVNGNSKARACRQHSVEFAAAARHRGRIKSSLMGL